MAEKSTIYSYPYRSYDDGLSEFCLVFDADQQSFSFEIETLLSFEDSINDPQKYISNVFEDFTAWMNENGYRTDTIISFWDYFDTDGINRHFPSVEISYVVFKTMIQGFINHGSQS